MCRIPDRPYVLLAAFTGLTDIVEHFEVLMDTLEVGVDLRTRRGTPDAKGPYDLIVQMGLGKTETGEKEVGLAFFCELKRRFPDTPIVVISRHDDAYEREEMRSLGAAGYLRRDNRNEPQEFIALMRELLKQKTAPR